MELLGMQDFSPSLLDMIQVPIPPAQAPNVQVVTESPPELLNQPATPNSSSISSASSEGLNDEPVNKSVDDEVEEQEKNKKEWVFSILSYLFFCCDFMFRRYPFEGGKGWFFFCVCVFVFVFVFGVMLQIKNSFQTINQENRNGFWCHVVIRVWTLIWHGPSNLCVGFVLCFQVETKEDKSEETERAEVRIHDKERGWSSGRWVQMEKVRPKSCEK